MIKKLSISILAICILATVAYLWLALPILSGYGAKDLCSCAYVGKRSEKEIIKSDLSNFPLSLGSFHLDLKDSSATGSVFGLASKKAIYRKGLGCTLISEISENTLRNQKLRSPAIQAPDSLQRIPFPQGDLVDYSKVNGVDYKRLNRAIDWAFTNTQDTLKNSRGIIVVYKDSIIAERYADGFDQNTPQIGWSMTKSITSTLIGILEKQNKIDIYQPAPLSIWQNQGTNITTDMLLRMSAGLDWNEDYSGPSKATNMLFKTANMGNFAAKQAQQHQPDAQWYYSSGTTNIISQLTKDVLGPAYHDFPYQELFYKIGMYHTVLEPDASGTYVGSSYAFGTPRDWARFGLLYLKDGNWFGEQIISERWTSYVSTPTPNDSTQNYGAQFWLNAGALHDRNNRPYPNAPTDIYSANGYDGQRVFIVPSHQLVVVRMGLSKRKQFDFDKFISEIINSLENGQ